ncbi:MAG: protein-L-isoaspartate(D-aspartate) O-methyltransferase [Endomicrobiia bacterium]|nr:protein-L-isoaspartate(D-aspartate) O-methyltransferase [Endomicrobiia bacterium]
MNAKEIMILRHLAARGIKDARVLAAMKKIPREAFLDEKDRPFAYDDRALPIGDGQTISQPYIVAKMTQLLAIGAIGKCRVLEIGTGSGYQTAILAELASEVFTVERNPRLAERARGILEDALGYGHIHFSVGDGTLGLPSEAPFDRIIVTAAAPSVPLPLFEQLGKNGRIVLPVGERHAQRLAVVSMRRRSMPGGGEPDVEFDDGCVFVPLVGKCGFSEQ